MQFAIYGSGALGSYFGAKLARQGHDVFFIARGTQLEALALDGLTVDSVDERFSLPEVHVTDDPAKIGPVDVVIVAVKAWQVEPLARGLEQLLCSRSRVLTLQNGVETPQVIAEQIGAERVLAGLVRGFFFMEQPGVVKHLGVQPTVIFGPVEGQTDERSQKLCKALLATGVHAEVRADIHKALWEKFMLVTALSGLGAVTRMAIGPLRDYAPTRQMLEDCMGEIDAVARARGIALDGDTVARTMAFIDTFPPEATASMQRDLMEGRPSELEAQTGAVVRLAAQCGVNVPLNGWLYHSLILQENEARRVLFG